LVENLEARNLLTTYAVDSLLDTSDNDTGDPACDDGAGYCTLRAAIEQANASANSGGADRIEFGLGGTISPSSALPQITEAVVIDGYAGAPSGASENTNGPSQGFNAVLTVVLDGNSAGNFVPGLRITGGGSTVRGLVIQRFDGVGIELVSDGNTVEGNFIGTSADGASPAGNNAAGIFVDGDNNIIGSSAGLGNLISSNAFGVDISGLNSDINHVLGNLIGTDKAGTIDLGNTMTGVAVLDGSNNVIGGSIAGARNVISGNDFHGIEIGGASAAGNVVKGNYIGTNVTGATDLGNAQHGISIADAATTQIGGTSGTEGNVISGNDHVGLFQNNTPSATIQGNLIGTDKDGAGNIGNADSGIFLDVGVNNTSVNGNTIAFNGTGVGSSPGLVLSDQAGVGNSILSNSFFQNAGIGIDIDQNGGQTPNDAGDGDGGPNLTQNFPVISSAVLTGNDLVVDYLVDTADTAPGTTNYDITVQFFEVDTAASGEGKTLLGSDTYAAADAQSTKTGVTLDVTGLGLSVADVIVATATDGNGNSSEFSAVFTVTDAGGGGGGGATNPMVYAGTDAADSLILRLNVVGDTIEIVNADSSTVVASAVKANTSNVVINTLDGNDNLTVDEANGLIDVGGGIQYDGGAGDDLMKVTGTVSIDSFFRVGPDPSSGSVDHTAGADTQKIIFTGLEPVIDLVPGPLTVEATAAANAINVNVGPNSGGTLVVGAASGQIQIDNFESIEFANKTDVTINAGGARIKSTSPTTSTASPAS